MESTEQTAIDGGAMIFGVVPLVFIGVLALACTVFYLWRRRQSIRDLEEALRQDDKEAREGGLSGFDSKELADLDPTRPSQRLQNKRDEER